MMDLLLSLIPGGGIGALFGGLLAVLAAVTAAFFKGRSSGANKERAKRDRARLDAKDEQLEMHREADAAEREAAGMSGEEAREEAMKWVKR